MKLYRKQAVGMVFIFTAMASSMVGSRRLHHLSTAQTNYKYNMNFCRLVLSSNLSTLPPYWESLYFFIEYSKHIAKQLPFFMCCHDHGAFLLLICSVCTLTIALTNPKTYKSSHPIYSMRELLFQTAMIALGAGSIFMCQTLLHRAHSPSSFHP